ncbi:hypothetical protein [Aquimarina sp. MAR_2010_214]|uniref:hypothetical protein n=1 Tax=Aquimarina sp. MAR_2010_214 TaxID=1250026 RepID=UPI00117801D4|nr:hypothetical protein [Aquimarina sp. MAR_2010_214]
METILNDLHLYELVLLFLGIFLFLILSAGLVYYIIRKEEIKKLLFFFPIPILMIGYPSVQEVTISGDKIAFSKYQDEYIQNPKDTVVKQKLEALTEKLEERAQTPEDILQISKAKLLLGNTKEAIEYADKAIEVEKEDADNETASSDTHTQKTKTTTQAKQLRQLAQIQDLVVNEKDTTLFNNKIRNMKVNEQLKGTEKIVQRNAINGITKKVKRKINH